MTEKHKILFENMEKSKSDKNNYVLKILSNGLKVLFISDPEASKSSAALGVEIGYLIDPPDAQGLAHFCEHLLFMGTKKYPDENDYEAYLSKNSGESNAFTDKDKTVYYFYCSNEGFDGALDRFAQFFICPLFNKDSVEREINAINSEHNQNKNNDTWRISDLQMFEAIKTSMFWKFGTGNKETLDLPDIRERLLVMYKKYYTSEIMNLCVYSKKPMKELINMVENLFILVPKRSDFIMPKYNEVFPFNETNLKYLYKIMPIKDEDTIQFKWFLPYCDNYHAKPLKYLISLFGHEGPNTLTSSLRKDNLITNLVCSYEDIGRTLSTFEIEITLTGKGFKNYKEVILRTLKYIKSIQSWGVNKKFFNEIRDVSQLQFDFQKKLTPEEYTQNYAQYLMVFKPMNILTGKTLFREFKRSLIRNYLNSLTLDNLNIYFSSQTFEDDCDLTEKYYGTKYSKEKIPFTEEEINEYKCKHVFGYPPENKFIPKNLDILPYEKIKNKYPEIILKKGNCNVWYLKDNKFRLPKVRIGAQFKLPKDYCNNSIVKNYVISYLLQKIIEKELGEILYMASEAKFKLKFKMKFYRTKIEISGFNDTIEKCVTEILKQYKNLNLDTDYCKEALKIEIKEMIEKYNNLFLDESYKVNTRYYKILISDPKVTLEEILDFLDKENISIKDLIDFKNNMFNQVKSDWLIQGMITEENALNIVNLINSILNIDIEKDLLSATFYNKRIVDINKNINYIYKFKNPNPEENDSSLLSVYRAGHLAGIDKEYFKIVHLFLEEKFFNQLRTKECLGYIVSLNKTTKYNVFSLVGIIQNSEKTPEYCSERIRNFFEEKGKLIKEISNEEFMEYVNSLIDEEKKKDTKLKQEFGRNWGEITRGGCEFDKKEKSIKNLEKCNKEDFIKFWEKYFEKDLTVLDCEYVCETHYEENEKNMKEVKDNGSPNIIERIICKNVYDFKNSNFMFPCMNNKLYKNLSENN